MIVQHTKTPIITLLARDGIIYYATMLGVSCVNVPFFFLSNHFQALSIANLAMDSLPASRAGLTACLSNGLRASFCIVGSRIMLNLRGVVMTDKNAAIMSDSFQLSDLSDSSGARSLPSIEFAHDKRISRPYDSSQQPLPPPPPSQPAATQTQALPRTFRPLPPLPHAADKRRAIV